MPVLDSFSHLSFSLNSSPIQSSKVLRSIVLSRQDRLKVGQLGTIC
ncbi:unnamed protein product, partial [Prunus brigantina]